MGSSAETTGEETLKGREQFTMFKKQLLDSRKASEKVAGFWQCVSVITFQRSA